MLFRSVEARPGTRARFSVKASLGGSAVFYQWQVNAVDIPGANRSVFFTPVLSGADNNKQYRVIVSAAGINSPSTAATLTVAGTPVLPATQPFLGVNFTGGGTGGAGGVLEPLDVAGVVQQQHFNNVRGGVGTDVELLDSTGALSGVTLDFIGGNISSTGSGSIDADHLLFQGYIHNNSAAGVVTLTLKNVPEGNYNLYVYSVGFNFNSIFNQAYTASGATTPPTLHVTAQHAGDYAASPAYQRASSTDPDARDKGNYVAFENLSPDPDGNLLLTVTSEATVAGITFMPAVNGFQLATVILHPALTVTTAGGVTISWGNDAAGFTLESSPSLGGSPPASWTRVNAAPNPIQSAGSIKIPLPTATKFYRLRK